MGRQMSQGGPRTPQWLAVITARQPTLRAAVVGPRRRAGAVHAQQLVGLSLRNSPAAMRSASAIVR